MTNKTKMKNNELFTELSIKIAILDAKLDKLLELLNKPEPHWTDEAFSEEFK